MEIVSPKATFGDENSVLNILVFKLWKSLILFIISIADLVESNKKNILIWYA